MNMTLKRTIGLLVATVIAVSSTALLAGCDKEKKETKTSGSSSATVSASGSVSATAPAVSGVVPLEALYDATLVVLLNKTYTINGNTISPGEFNFYMINGFTTFSQYAYYGYYPSTADGMIDLTASCEFLDNGTWADYLNSYVKKDIQRRYLLSALAKENGMVLSKEQEASIDTSIKNIVSQAETTGMTGDGYVSQYFGDNMTLERYRSILEVYQLAEQYLAEFISNYAFSDEEIQLPTVRHILYKALKNSKTESENATEAEIANAKAKAEATKATITTYDEMVLAGDRDVTAKVADQAAEYVVSKGMMVPEFEAWCYDPARKIGDTGIVQTDYGFHIMFYVGKTTATDEEKSTIAQNALSGILDKKAALPEFSLVEQ